MRKAFLIFVIALAAAFAAWPQKNGGGAKKGQLDGAWELVSGQELPKGTIDVKIISGGHFIFVAYDAESGKSLYTGGGTYTLQGNSYIEHIDFMSDAVSAALVGKDQQFIVKLDGNTFTQTGTLSNGRSLSEIWKRF